MTKLLEEAFRRASELPIALQDEIAKDLLQEIEWEHKWDTAFEEPQDALEHLANEALAEYRAGKTIDKGFDEI